jgi:eukaryotic-like serine/threonine-protein kinase
MFTETIRSSSERPTAIEGMSGLVGRRLNGRYRLEKMIGSGGMGVVFRGTKLDSETVVAIKMLRPELANNFRYVQLFEEEARILDLVRHPNNVRMIDAGHDRKCGRYLVTELLTGRPLSAVLAGGRALSVKTSLWIAEQICRALSKIHGHKIVHRDLKPENVFVHRVGDRGLVKLIDFGIARASGEDVEPPSAVSLSGTPRYLPPERLRNEPVDHRADIYSLGVVLYEMLSGTAPFVSDNMNRLLYLHLRETPMSLLRLVPERAIPAELDRLVLRMLAKLPEERPQSVEEVLAKIAVN